MPERETYTRQPRENLATRINYSPITKGLFGMAIFGTAGVILQSLERPPTSKIPIFMRGHLFDVMSVPFTAAQTEVVLGDNLQINALCGFATSSVIEIGQKLGLTWGTYDPWDFAAYGVGAVVWTAFDGSAKLIHDSGLTLPIYRLLKIKHKKFG